MCLKKKHPARFRKMFRIVGVSLRNDVDHEVILSLLKRESNFEILGGSDLEVNILVSPNEYTSLRRHLRKYGIRSHIKVSNLQSLIEDEAISENESRTKRSLDTACEDCDISIGTQPHVLDTYPTLEKISVWLEELQINYPELVEVLDIGRTYENRTLQMIKVSLPSTEVKPKIWIESGIHAREWISITTAIYVVEMLVYGYDVDGATTLLLQTYDWYFLVVANPDGYQYTKSTNRMWRKNRSNFAKEYCSGTDINRNFPFHWKGHCFRHWISVCPCSDPCQPTYAGGAPGSELETQAIMTVLLGNHTALHRKGQAGAGWMMALSLHSFSQLWLMPWSHGNKKPADYHDLMVVAQAATTAIFNTHGELYYPSNPVSKLYMSGGTLMDWAKGVAGVKYTYAIELRDKGSNGYLLPARYIEPVGFEAWNGIKAAAFKVAEKQGLSPQM